MLNFIFRGNELLIQEPSLALPDATACSALSLQPEHLQQVWINDPDVRTTHVPLTTEPPAGYAFRKLRALLGELGEHAPLAGRAFQIAEWARTHRYCGVCATPMEPLSHEFCMRCPSCGMSAYPRISPAMMVLVRKGDHILLARHATYATARHTALAGFVEAGESIEDAIHREVYEEVGLRVTNLRYFGSQSWPFPHSLMIAFTAEYVEGEIRVQPDEIAEAHWYGPDDTLPEIPAGETIAGRLIRASLSADACS